MLDENQLEIVNSNEHNIIVEAGGGSRKDVHANRTYKKAFK